MKRSSLAGAGDCAGLQIDGDAADSEGLAAIGFDADGGGTRRRYGKNCDCNLQNAN